MILHHNLLLIMLNIQQLKQKVLKEVEKNGYLNNVRAQMKTEVYEIIEKESSKQKNKIGWQWQHPGISKILISQSATIILDLIEQFLNWFGFSYTLSVFKKQLNRKQKINRNDIKGKLLLKKSNQDKPIIMSIIDDIMSGQIQLEKKGKLQELNLNKNNTVKKTDNIYINQNKNSQNIIQHKINKQKEKQKQKLIEKQKKQKTQKQKIQKQKTQKQKIQKLKIQKQKTKPPQTASDFLNTLPKFQKNIIQKKKTQQNKRPQTAPVKKQIPVDAGINKIRGKQSQKNLSQTNDPYSYDLGTDPYNYNIETKNNSYNYKINNNKDFYSYDISGQQNLNQGYKNKLKSKNEQIIQEDIDEFQISKDSRKNPLFTSSQSIVGASQSQGYDYSVDSLQIQQFDYYQNAKKKK